MIVITGGSRGIGKAIVRRFSAEGYPIATCGRNIENLNRLKKSIAQKYSHQVYTFPADLSNKKQCKAFGKYVLELKQPIDLLVNNAGMFIPGEIHREKEGTLEKMIATNLYSAYDMTRSLLPEMMAKKKGHVINICSVASIRAYPNGSTYCIAKHAMYGFSKCLREELKPHGIRVTTLLPGATLTESWEGVDLPSERFIQVEDIAETIYTCYQMPNTTVLEDIIIRPQLGDV